jgi:hypothetical protein
MLLTDAFRSWGILLLLNLWGLPSGVTAQTVPCSTSAHCEETLRPGSQCIEGFCTNPFYHGGCLKSLLPDWEKPRVCNSLDPPEAKELGYCRDSPFDYAEVRIASTNWESANLGAWILQILLSEILDVPTSLEGGFPDVKTTFIRPLITTKLTKINITKNSSRRIESRTVEPFTRMIPNSTKLAIMCTQRCGGRVDIIKASRELNSPWN